MIYLITLFGVCAFISMLFIAHRANYWKNKFIDSGYGTELELATFDQIVKELRSRPEGYMIINSNDSDIVTINGDMFYNDKKGVVVIRSKIIGGQLTIKSNLVNSEVAMIALKKIYDEMISDPKNADES